MMHSFLKPVRDAAALTAGLTLASLCLFGRAAETADSKTAGEAAAPRVQVGGEVGKAILD